MKALKEKKIQNYKKKTLILLHSYGEIISILFLGAKTEI